MPEEKENYYSVFFDMNGDTIIKAKSREDVRNKILSMDYKVLIPFLNGDVELRLEHIEKTEMLEKATNKSRLDIIKIAINRGKGFLSLSEEAVKELELLGFRISLTDKDTGNWLDKDAEIIDQINRIIQHSQCARFILNYNLDQKKLRTDLRLIDVIEKLGQSAAGLYTQLKIIEIPDNIKWNIKGTWKNSSEYIQEEHRKWF
jgi:hypothetical protein